MFSYSAAIFFLFSASIFIYFLFQLDSPLE